MINGILGKKIGMTRLFSEDGRWVPVTLIECGPCVVVQRKTQEKDGYDSVQVGYGAAKEKRLSKPLKGHFNKAGVAPARHLQEFRVSADETLEVGAEIKVDLFEKGQMVDVTGTSKGKGFAGVIKRHGYKGGPGGHGSNFHRAPGSIGQSADPSKVYKGKGLPGRMGHTTITVQRLQIVDVLPEKNLLVVKGAVPGANGGLVTVNHTVKG
jgi:large subunit ribosomal protein L3